MLDALNVWFSDRFVTSYFFFPETQNSARQTSTVPSTDKQSRLILRPSSIFLTAIQTLLFFFLVKPEDEQKQQQNEQLHSAIIDANRTNSFPYQSVASHALVILQSIYRPLFEALNLVQRPTPDTRQQQSNGGASCLGSNPADSESIFPVTNESPHQSPFSEPKIQAGSDAIDSSTAHVDELLELNWFVWLPSILHSYSIIAAFCPHQYIRAQVLSVGINRNRYNKVFVVYRKKHLCMQLRKILFYQLLLETHIN